MTYQDKWICNECGHVSDDEHAPCDCDDDCCAHVGTIAGLRRQVAALRGAVLEFSRLTGEMCGHIESGDSTFDRRVQEARSQIASSYSQRAIAIARKGDGA